MPECDVQIGTTLLHRELHDRWGGSRFGGMEPAVKARSVFLFTKPGVGENFGYNYDGWHPDATFHYTGDGQEGDQSLDSGGNKALITAASLGRTVRLFRSERTYTTYLGAFTLADPPYYRADSPDRHGEIRSVLVFRLTPLDGISSGSRETAEPTRAGPQEVPLEANNTAAYAAQRPDEPSVAVRREAELVRQYDSWLAARGQKAVRHRIPLPEGGHLLTDLYNKTVDELIEAKGSSARVYVRAGLGQILDYSRFLPHKRRALLLPTQPPADLTQLLHDHRVGVVWKEGATFARSDPPSRAHD